jgi:hypothetical protein
MKILKVKDGKFKIDGVWYSDKVVDTPIMGKSGRIQSISIGGRQFFPYAGEFESIPTTSDEVKPSKTKSKTK